MADEPVTLAQVKDHLRISPSMTAQDNHLNLLITTSTPAIWHFLGYQFEAAGMIAALFGCFSARFWIGAAQSVRDQHRWSLDIPVTGMALAVSAALVISQRPEPLGGLMLGAGLGILGEGIFKLAESYLQKVSAVFGVDTDKAD